MKTGLFFGSFNPIHIGHLIIAEAMVAYTDLKQLWFVVSPHNPFKKANTLLHQFDRYDMIKIAIDNNPHFKVSDIEFNMPRPNYTIDTLAYLSEKNPDRKFCLIMGEDNLKTLPKWKNYRHILENFPIFVYPRNNHSNTSLIKHAHITVVNAPKVDISATFVRKAIQEGKSVRYLLTEPLLDFIRMKKFYGT